MDPIGAVEVVNANRDVIVGISPDGSGVDAETECPQFARTAGVRAGII